MLAIVTIIDLKSKVMDFDVFIGVDVSKETLDFAAYRHGKELCTARTGNDKKGIEGFCKDLKKQAKGAPEEKWLWCMEHTGVYCNPLKGHLSGKGMALWLENAAEVKAFHGLARGKGDAVDAKRIAVYAQAKSGQAKLWQAPRGPVLRLKALLKLRERLVAARKGLLAPLREDERFAGEAWAKEHKKLLGPAVGKLDRQVKEVEKETRALVKSDRHIARQCSLASSVCGVGEVTAWNMVVATNEFKDIGQPKKMACHCGVAPFSYTSGSSVRGKAKVSHRADKHMKVLLHMAAMAAISTKGELRDYYLRKVAEGKNKMAVLNAVRNKIIHRVFACIRDNRKYEKSYARALA